MPTAMMSSQLSIKDEKEFEPELIGPLLSNATMDLDLRSIQTENFRTNLGNLNAYLDLNLNTRQAAEPIDDGTNKDPSIPVKERVVIDPIANNLGHEAYNQVEKTGGIASSPGEPNTHTIKSESDDNLLMDFLSSPPRKRQRRGLKMEVVVPTMDVLRHERLFKAEEDYKKLEKMHNPKVKKNKDMVLHPDTLRARLPSLDLYPITLDKGSQDLMVSRDFMAAKYGGSMQATCPTIGKKLVEKHGMDDFMYLHPAYQPVAPQVPGAHGLFLITGSTIGHIWPLVQRVFTRIDSNIWQYMGMYRLTPSPSLTTEEWADQEPKVQKTWGREICRQGWGGDVRARVFSRKRLGRKPTSKELEDLSLEGSRAHSVTPEDIMEAFSKGEETLGIWLMECVGYDSAFQLELCEKFPLWVPPPKRTRGKGNKTKAAGPPVRNDRKRKREESPESDVDVNPKNEEDESELEWENNEPTQHEEHVEELTYRKTGTRSRPICL